MDFTREGLKSQGFAGWVTFAELGRGEDCPRESGVYIVHYGGAPRPTFSDQSCGGWFKGKDPTVALDSLAANWVDGAEVVYIGKADDLRRRLRQFAQFGAGKAIGHWGGRLIWQLRDIDRFRVAWKTTPASDPLVIEAQMIAAFRARHGKPPFANAPHRLGS